MMEELAALEQIAGRAVLGNVTVAAENARAAIGFPLLHALSSDIRYCVRGLLRERAFTVIAVISLALGMAANISIFGLMDTLLWRELPVAEPEQLVSFENTSRSYFGYSEFAKHSADALQDVLAQSPQTDTALDSGYGPDRGAVEFVSNNYFAALGVKAVYGRLQLRDAARTAVISYTYWRRAFHSDPSAIGHSIHVGDGGFEITGIAPEDLFGLSVGEAPDIWLPITAQPAVSPNNNWLIGRNNNWLYLFGRLRPAVTIQRAEAILAPVSLEIDIERNGGTPTAAERKQMLLDHMRLEPAARGISFLRDRFSKPLRVVFGMLAVGLLLACINVVSLQIARADERQREFAVRLAIGASRVRILRQCFVESLILAGVSGVLACLLFQPATSGIVSLVTLWGGEPAHLNLALHREVIAFVAALCCAVALLSGFLPALYASRKSIQPGLQVGSPATAPKRQRGLVRVVGIVQIAVSIVMITGTCVLAGSLHQLRTFDGGVKRDRLFELSVDPMRIGYADAKAVALDARLRDRFAAIPDVEAVSFSQNGLYLGRNSENRFEADGFHPADSGMAHGIYDFVGPGFFKTLGTKMLDGRDFNASDNAAGAKVIIVNQTFAERVFPNHDALGRNVYLSEQSGRTAYRIIGVVRDVRDNVRIPQLTWYFPALQHADHPFSTSFIIRAKNAGTLRLSELTASAKAENSSIRVDSFESADNLLNGTLDTDRLMARLGWALGILSASLASVGIYGLVSYDVTRRRGEIGIRSALGAGRPDIAKLVLSEVMLVAGFGITLGGLAAVSLSGLVRGLVFGLDVRDPRFELAAAAVLLIVAFSAAAIPARRAAMLDPMRALRAE